MKTRRRSWLRDETVAPWLTILVLLTLWWGAARLVRLASSPAEHAPAAAPVETPAVPDPARDVERTAAERGVDAIAPSVTRTGESDAPLVPVVGIDAASLTSTFDEARGGGSRRHEAMDILAPRGTPVIASVEGRVVKLFTSAAGGLTVYQFDAREEYCYYYAHLDAYAPDLTEGQVVRKGQIIGYVGTTGNAPPGTPHLHFAIYRLGAEKKWWDGEPLDPLTFLR